MPEVSAAASGEGPVILGLRFHDDAEEMAGTVDRGDVFVFRRGGGDVFESGDQDWQSVEDSMR